MAYTDKNYKTKKALKEDVAAGKQVTVYDNSLFGTGKVPDGTCFLEGPHSPAPHTWYAQAIVKDGIIQSVK